MCVCVNDNQWDKLDTWLKSQLCMANCGSVKKRSNLPVLSTATGCKTHIGTNTNYANSFVLQEKKIDSLSAYLLLKK